MKKLSVSVALIGARMHYAVPKIFYKKGILGFLYTDLYFSGRGLNITRLISHKIYNTISLRHCDELPDKKVVPFNALGVEYKFRKSLPKKIKMKQGMLWLWAGRVFDEKIIKHVDKREAHPDIIYGINCASRDLFKYCKSKGVTTVLEQCSAPMAYENSIMLEEYESYEDWEIGLYKENLDCVDFINNEADEWELADLIVAPSEYVKNALVMNQVNPEKIKVIPYGYDAIDIYTPQDSGTKKEKMNVLFVGGLRLQKGIQYFYELSELLDKDSFDFRAVGHNFLHESILSKIMSTVDVIGAVKRNEMVDQYCWADVLIVPSLSEGSATVIYEALSYGVPVICTENSGSVITNGKDGYVVKIRDVGQMKECLLKMAESESLLNELKKQAKITSLNFTTQKYGESLVSTMQTLHRIKEC